MALRRQRWTGQQAAHETGVSPATVSRILRRARLSRIRDLEPAEPVIRYERKKPGDMIHLDIKKLGRFERVGHRITGDRTAQSNSRGIGWEFVHVCIDDNSRISFSQIFPDEKAVSAMAFLKAALAYYKGLGVSVARVMTDNGSCYKSHAFRDLCRDLKLRHIRTKPYTPKTNGKAERFIQTALREWAYAKPYPSSDQRAAELPTWLHRYNWHRPHGGIKLQTPISRLGLTVDNLLGLQKFGCATPRRARSAGVSLSASVVDLRAARKPSAPLSPPALRIFSLKTGAYSSQWPSPSTIGCESCERICSGLACEDIYSSSRNTAVEPAGYFSGKG